MFIVLLLVMVLSLIAILRKKDDTDIKKRADTKQTWIDKLSSAEVTTEKKTTKSEDGKAEKTTSSTKKSDKKNVTADKNNKKSSAKTDVDTKTSKGSKSSAQNTTEKSVKTSSDRTVQDATTESTTQNAAGGVTERATQEATTERRTERATQEAVTERRTESTTERTIECQHDWVAQTKTEKVLVEEGWDEDVYELSSKCAYCGKDTSDGTHDPGLCGELVYDEDMGDYFLTGAAEVSYQKYVKTIHHPDVYEDKTVTTGYVCSKCGATK